MLLSPAARLRAGLLTGVVAALPLGAALAQDAPTDQPKLRPVHGRRVDDSVYARRTIRQRYFLDLLNSNRPISWISALGEQSTRHRTSGYSSDRNPDYVFTAYLTTSFVVVSQPRVAFTIDPAFLLRMRYGGGTQDSYPVRTPSYHPAANLFILTRFRTEPPAVQFTDQQPVTRPDDNLRYQYLRLGVHHHSNGQQGEALVNGQINELNGNFVANFLEASYVFGTRTDRAAFALQPYGAYGLRLDADPTQLNRYLFHRVGLRMTREAFSSWRRVLGKPELAGEETTVQLARRNKSRLYGELNVSYGLGSLRLLPTADRGFQKRVNAEATVVFIPRFMYQTGLFVTAGYYGEDPYNIWYLHRYAFVRAGIATAAFRNVTQLLK